MSFLGGFTKADSNMEKRGFVPLALRNLPDDGIVPSGGGLFCLSDALTFGTGGGLNISHNEYAWVVEDWKVAAEKINQASFSHKCEYYNGSVVQLLKLPPSVGDMVMVVLLDGGTRHCCLVSPYRNAIFDSRFGEMAIKYDPEKLSGASPEAIKAALRELGIINGIGAGCFTLSVHKNR